MKVFSSRFTPGVSAADIDLRVGERVKVIRPSGEICTMIIASMLMNNVHYQELGYECKYKGKTLWVSANRIISWNTNLK